MRKAPVYKIFEHRYSPFFVALYTVVQGLLILGMVQYGTVSTIRSCS